MSVYVIPGKPTITVDLGYFKLIQADSELYEYLVSHGVDKWDGYTDAEQEYNDDKGN